MDDTNTTPEPVEEKDQELEALTQAGSDAAVDVITIEAAIKTRMAQLEKNREDAKVQREMIESFLAQEPKYQELVKLAKQANQQKNGVKNQLLKTPQVANNVQNLRDLREQQKEIQEGLSYYLREYQRVTGANQFEGDDGEMREIIYIAKLVRKSGFKK